MTILFRGRARGRARTWRVDFRTGRRSGEREFSRYVAGPGRRPLVVADPTGGPPVALTRFATHDGERCVEPGRLIAGEAGVWSPEWGAFLDLPTLVPLAGYTAGDWQPVAPTPQSTNGCDGADETGSLGALVARRIGPELLAVGGLLRPGTRRLAVRRPDGRFADLAVRDGAFLAALPSTGAVGEQAALEVTDRRGRRSIRRVATGDVDALTDLGRIDVVEGGSVLRVQWTGGFEPYSGVDVERRPGQVRVRVLTRYPPEFSVTGTGYAVAAIAISKCVDVVLPEPVRGETPTDHRGRVPREDGEGFPSTSPPCARVTPGHRVDLPLSIAPTSGAEREDIARRD